jgi:hypothetical protein
VFGQAGNWVITDKDQIAVHNLNRSLLFTAAEAGWPTGTPRYKCDVVAEALHNAVPARAWYDEYVTYSASEFDVVLCLANERGIRHDLVSKLQHSPACNHGNQLDESTAPTHSRN